MLGENLSSAEAIGQVKFDSSGLTNLMALQQGMPAAHVNFTSLAAVPRFQVKGVCTPVELCTFMNHQSALSSAMSRESSSASLPCSQTPCA